MVTWNNKLVTFLSGGNTIKFTTAHGFDEFKAKMKSIGLDIGKFDFHDIAADSRRDARHHNRPYTLGNAILVNYDNGHGFGYGWASEKSSEEWYEMKPFTWAEVKEEFC